MSLYLVCSAAIAAVLMWELWQKKRDELSCRYCGTYRGHQQDCPLDFLNREERNQ